MAEVVNSHQQGLFTVPVDATTANAAEVLGNDNNIRTAYNAHDADGGLHLQSSALSARPAFGTAGRKWLTTDGLRIYYDTGAAWSEIQYLSLAAGGTVAGATSFSSSLGVSGSGSGCYLASFNASPGTLGQFSCGVDISDRFMIKSEGAGTYFSSLNGYYNFTFDGTNSALQIKGETFPTPNKVNIASNIYVYSDASFGGGYLKLTIDSQTGNTVTQGEVRVLGDTGGVASANTLTGTSDLTANSSGVGTILFKGATSRDSSGFIKIYIGTTAYYIPVFSAITG